MSYGGTQDGAARQLRSGNGSASWACSPSATTSSPILSGACSPRLGRKPAKLLETVGPLTDPAARDGAPEDAFDLVLPSMPGYGFSAEPAEVGWAPAAPRAPGRS